MPQLGQPGTQRRMGVMEHRPQQVMMKKSMRLWKGTRSGIATAIERKATEAVARISADAGTSTGIAAAGARERTS